MLDDVQETIVVSDMHTRKKLMFDRSDAFVALPGGIGTLEELVEQMTWSQLGQHAKPILLLSVAGSGRRSSASSTTCAAPASSARGLDLSFLVAEEPDQVVPMLREAIARTAPRPEAEALIEEKF